MKKLEGFTPYTPEGKTTLDLSLFDRFDAETKAMQIKISSVGIAVSDEAFKEKKFAVYLSKSGTKLVLVEDETGYPVARAGRGVGTNMIYCSAVTRALEERGINIPQQADLMQDATVGGYVAELKKAKTDLLTERAAAQRTNKE